ncbi:hypothetical protein CEXT_748431 [Caerostris extrusa]|uniref:Uncharacterized protein n=1 Tax=Caerostris extrusa TaxID=172846 RepID=A0AAV4N7N0_CAEEX|nr:hypothetical protein CEXT_748431 [Caerostris extrusa]
MALDGDVDLPPSLDDPYYFCSRFLACSLIFLYLSALHCSDSSFVRLSPLFLVLRYFHFSIFRQLLFSTSSSLDDQIVRLHHLDYYPSLPSRSCKLDYFNVHLYDPS